MSTSVNKGGRPSKYDPAFCEQLIKYFSIKSYRRYVKSEKITTKSNGTTEVHRDYGFMSNDMPMLSGFARKIGVAHFTLIRWADKKNENEYPGFCEAYNEAKELQKAFLASIGLKGFAPPASFIFVTKNVTDWKDKNETEHSGNLTWSEQPPK